MPLKYNRPTGNRKVEFWQCYRNGEHSEMMNIPVEWDDDEIHEELKDWCEMWGHQYEYSYGWNDEKDFGKR